MTASSRSAAVVGRRGASISTGSTGVREPRRSTDNARRFASATPGSSSAACRPRGPHSIVTLARGGEGADRRPGEQDVAVAVEPTASRRRVIAGHRARRSTASFRSRATSGAAATSSARVTGVGTRMARAPAASAADTSLPMSPTTAQAVGGTPRRRPRRRSCRAPACGSGNRRRRRGGRTARCRTGRAGRRRAALTATTSSLVNSPRATPD